MHIKRVLEGLTVNSLLHYTINSCVLWDVYKTYGKAEWQWYYMAQDLQIGVYETRYAEVIIFCVKYETICERICASIYCIKGSIVNSVFLFGHFKLLSCS